VFKKILFSFFTRTHGVNPQKVTLPNGVKTTLSEPFVPETANIRDYPDDETLRENHPAVKDAWEQYQMLIKLHGGLTEVQRIKMKSKRRRPMKK